MEKKFLENSLSMTIQDWLYYHQQNLHFSQKYKGLNMIKNPLDLIVYEEIFWEVRPTIVIEIGSMYGGFSLWLRDRMRMVGVKGKIITVDLQTLADNNFKDLKLDNLISLVGNCNSPDVIAQVKKIISRSDRVLIIEDSAHTFENTFQMLENYKEIVTVGSYLIVEDGICDLLDLGISPGPMKAVEDWIRKNPNFEIDRSRERYVMTYNPKGYLRRIN